ncbi:MAG: SIMPL domain-containing protein [Sedimentisphaerales bacterium]|nr:SIMPL domain-containing protein [Sedimentisphaerales bacterium]
MRKSIVILLVMSTLFSVAQIALAQTDRKFSTEDLSKKLLEATRITNIDGSAEIKVQADQAIVNARVTTESKTLKDALAKNQKLRGEIQKQLENKGITKDRIKASSFSSAPKYGLFGDKYVVENLLKITLKDSKEFQVAAEIIDSNEEVKYEGIEFEHSNKDQLKKDALAKACDKVIEKQEIYEDKFDVKLQARSFNSPSVTMINQSPSYGRRSAGVSYKTANLEQSYSSDEAGLESTVTMFGEIVFRANITVEFTTTEND